MNMDICSLWWCEQWVQERMAVLGKTDMQKLSSCKTWVWKNKAKAKAEAKL